MMKPRKYVAALIYFILFKFMLKYYVLAQNLQCTLDTTKTVPNICDSPNYLVYVSETDCPTEDSKCWCILVDNQYSDYDGDMMIELVQIYNRNSLHPAGIQFGKVKSNLEYKIISGINIFIVQLPPDAITKITSIKLRNTEVCKFGNTLPFQQPINVDDPTISNDPTILIHDVDSNRGYRDLADCIHRNIYTENSIKYCPTDRLQFMIEKRITLNNHTYWCININNDNNAFTSANHLTIVYFTSPHQKFFYWPLDAYTGNGFMLGNRLTSIAVSEQNNQLTNLKSVTIDNKTICSYIDQPVTPIKIDKPLIASPNSNSSMPKCGIKPSHRNSVIINELSTRSVDWPWQANIYKTKKKETNSVLICGGTLINQKTVVTAAHCVFELYLTVIPERLTVELGRNDFTITVTTQPFWVYDVIPHEYYNSDTFENDIAILILGNYVRITRYVNFICLPSPDEILQHQVGKVVGWGNGENYKIQADLKVATLPVVEDITCLASNREFFGQYLTSTNFCAGFLNNTNLYSDDTGNGLVFRSQNHWFLGGITSLCVSAKTNARECDKTQYALFTDVTKFISWIKKNS